MVNHALAVEPTFGVDAIARTFGFESLSAFDVVIHNDGNPPGWFMCPSGFKDEVYPAMTPVELTYAKLAAGGFKGQFIVLDNLFDDDIGERIKLKLPAEALSGEGPFVVKPVPTYFYLLTGVPFVNAGSSIWSIGPFIRPFIGPLVHSFVHLLVPFVNAGSLSAHSLTLIHIHPRSSLLKEASQRRCSGARLCI